MQLGAMGPTTASCLQAMGRQFAAWLGLTPGQYSSGCKARLGRIIKAADAYLRSFLVLGIKALLASAKTKIDGTRAGRTTRLLARGGHCGPERQHGLGDA